MPAGRPTKYKPEYCQGIIDYFHDSEGCPLIQDYAHSIGVNKTTLYEWEQNYPDFSNAIKTAREMQESKLVSGALTGKFQQAFSIFMAKNIIGWRDKHEVDHTGNIIFQAPTVERETP